MIKHIFLLFVLIFLVYSNIFQNQFVIDDHLFIKNWEITKSLTNIPAMFAGETTPQGHEGVYRPMRAVLYALTYQFWGLNLFGYHLQSLVIHLLVVLCVYLIAGQLTRHKILPLVIAGIYGLHPLQTEAITYMTANFDIWGAVFFFSSFYCYLRQKRITSLSLAVLAIFTYEMTIVLPAIIVLHQICFKSKISKKRVIPYFLIVGLFLFIRVGLLHITSRGEYLNDSFALTMLTMSKAYLRYFILLIFPLHLSINPLIAPGIQSWVNPLTRMENIINQSIFEPYFLAAVATILGLVVSAVVSVKKIPGLTFGLGWFFLSVLPVSYLVPQGPIMQERYIYIASFGFIFAIISLLTYLYENQLKARGGKKLRPYIVGLTIIAVVLLGTRTYIRNFDWRSNYTIWKSLVSEVPDDIIANYRTAQYAQKAGKDEEAIVYYQRAISFAPKIFEAHIGLAEINKKRGNWPTAISEYEQTLTIYPHYLPAEQALATLQKGVEQDLPSAVSQKYIDQNLAFSYPENWLVEEGQHIKIKSPQGYFAIEIFSGEESKQNYGKLINQGSARIPNMDQADVKIWDNRGMPEMQFFLRKNNKVITILVYPAVSTLMGEFDKIISTLQVK